MLLQRRVGAVDTSRVEADDSTGAERSAAFTEMFGVSEDELVAQGVDIGQYIHDNAKRGIDRLYEVPAQKLAAGESVLPYQATVPYIAKGVTVFSRDRSGRVTVDRSTIRLLDADGNVLAESPPSEVTVRRVLVWFGMGVRLVMSGGVAWRVQPRGFPNENIRKARQANKVFRAALLEAGANFGRIAR